jgi:hypothetical protein
VGGDPVLLLAQSLHRSKVLWAEWRFSSFLGNPVAHPVIKFEAHNLSAYTIPVGGRW